MPQGGSKVGFPVAFVSARSIGPRGKMNQGAQSTCSLKKMEMHVRVGYLIVSLMVIINKYCVSIGHLHLRVDKVISSKLSFRSSVDRRM